MAAYLKFECFAYDLEEKRHEFSVDAYKVALTNTAPSAANTLIGDITEIAAGNGYTAGGSATTISTTEVSGVKTILGTEVTFTASGGTIGPLRWAVLYNSSNNRLVAYADYGSSVTVANGKFFRVRFGGASPGVIHTLT